MPAGLVVLAELDDELGDVVLGVVDVLGDWVLGAALPVVVLELPDRFLLRTMLALTSQHWLDDAPLEPEPVPCALT